MSRGNLIRRVPLIATISAKGWFRPGFVKAPGSVADIVNLTGTETILRNFRSRAGGRKDLALFAVLAGAKLLQWQLSRVKLTMPCLGCGHRLIASWIQNPDSTTCQRH